MYKHLLQTLLLADQEKKRSIIQLKSHSNSVQAELNVTESDSLFDQDSRKFKSNHQLKEIRELKHLNYPDVPEAQTGHNPRIGTPRCPSSKYRENKVFMKKKKKKNHLGVSYFGDCNKMGEKICYSQVIEIKNTAYLKLSRAYFLSPKRIPWFYLLQQINGKS